MNAGSTAAAHGQEKTDDPLDKFYSSRAEEYLKRYESMRDLEWKIVFQMYAGYGVIAAAFVKVAPEFCDHKFFIAIAMGATVSLYAAFHYVYFRIQERLIVFNETHEAYAGKNAARVEDSLGKELGQASLRHKYFWTYDVQMTLSTLACVGLLAYEFFHVIYLRKADKPRYEPSWWPFITCVILTGLIAFLARARLALRLGRIQLSVGSNTAECDWFSKWIFKTFSRINIEAPKK